MESEVANFLVTTHSAPSMQKHYLFTLSISHLHPVTRRGLLNSSALMVALEAMFAKYEIFLRAHESTWHILGLVSYL